MVHGVVAHNVTLLHHPPDQVRVALYVVANQEKGGAHLMLFQGVQHLFRAAVFVARVKGQIQHLFPGIPQVGGVVLPQLLHPRGSHRRAALLPEAQAPAGRRHRRLIKYPHHSQNRQGDGGQKDGSVPFAHRKSPPAITIRGRGSFRTDYFSANRGVDRYRSPVSGSSTTMFLPLFSGRLAS